jgi:hypothetical protein
MDLRVMDLRAGVLEVESQLLAPDSECTEVLE